MVLEYHRIWDLHHDRMDHNNRVEDGKKMADAQSLNGQAGNKQTTETEKEEEEEEEHLTDPNLIRWEEWALSAEEHLHALQKFRANPKGKPLGHR